MRDVEVALALMEMKFAPDSFATALATRVFPHPGGPKSSTPQAAVSPMASKRLGNFIGSVMANESSSLQAATASARNPNPPCLCFCCLAVSLAVFFPLNRESTMAQSPYVCEAADILPGDIWRRGKSLPADTRLNLRRSRDARPSIISRSQSGADRGEPRNPDFTRPVHGKAL